MAATTTAAGTREQQRTSARQHRREMLLDAADRVISRLGPQASMDEIASEAGITKPILYRHFGDKDGLHQALAARYVDALMSALRSARAEGHPRANIAAGIDAYLSFIEREPERYRFLLGAADEPGSSALVAEFRRRLAAECAEDTATRLRRASLDPEIAEPWAYGVVGMVRSIGVWWLETRSVPRERLVEHVTSLLWEGIAPLRERGRRRPSSG